MKLPVYKYIIAEQYLFVYIYWKNQYLSYRLQCIDKRPEQTFPVLLRPLSGCIIYINT